MKLEDFESHYDEGRGFCVVECVCVCVCVCTRAHGRNLVWLFSVSPTFCLKSQC